MSVIRSLRGAIRAWPVVWLGLAGSTLAQVSVEVLLEQDHYLRDETLPVEVRITNRSGQDLRLGQGDDWISFTIERKDGHFAARTGQPPLAGEFTLESSMVAKRRLDLMPYFSLGEAGRYSITAQVKIPQWDQEIFSKPKTFDMTRGTPIWEQTFGVPVSEGLPEVRRYELIQAHTFKRLMLYVRLTDASELKVFRVLTLGQLVSFSRPEAQVDKQSNLHVLFQTGARAFLYYQMNPEGSVLMRQIYDYGTTRPGLKNNEEGKIFVSGGQRRFTPSDLPAVPTSPATPAEPAVR